MNITSYNAEVGGDVVETPVQIGVGTTTYYAQSANGNCINASRTAVTLTKNELPLAPIVAETVFT